MNVSPVEVTDFLRDISSRVDRGESLTAAFTVAGTGTNMPSLQQAALGIVNDLQNGTTLSQSMAKYPALFDADYCTVIRRGEISGRLEDALRILA